MNFRKKLRKGGVISNLKNFIANLVLVQPVCGKNRNIFSEKGAGGEGGSGAVRKFSGNSSVFVCTGFPKSCESKSQKFLVSIV